MQQNRQLPRYRYRGPPALVALHRRAAVRHFRFGGLRHHATQHPARHGALRRLLLHVIYCRRDRRRLGHVAAAALILGLCESMRRPYAA